MLTKKSIVLKAVIIAACAAGAFATAEAARAAMRSRAAAAAERAAFETALAESRSAGVSEAAASQIAKLVVASERTRLLTDEAFGASIESYASFEGDERRAVERFCLGLVLQMEVDGAWTSAKRTAAMAVVAASLAEAIDPSNAAVAVGCAQDLGIERDAEVKRAIDRVRTRWPRHEFLHGVINEVYHGIPSPTRR